MGRKHHRSALNSKQWQLLLEYDIISVVAYTKIPSADEVKTANETSGDGTSGPSDFARELNQVKADTLAAAGKRSHLPQPLFWSLFHARLAGLKNSKQAVRELEELFSTKL